MKNLFDYATKELSQDAFLRWLFESWKEVEECSDIVRKMIKELCGFEVEIDEIKTRAQEKDIDITIEITTKEEENPVYIFIEDKTFSNEHKQLIKYDEYINTFSNAYKLFYKTSILTENDENGIEKANKKNRESNKSEWQKWDLNKIITLFEGKEVYENLILQHYVKHIRSIQKNTQNTEKPKTSDKSIDWIQWEAYFKNTIIPRLQGKGYKCDAWKAGPYPYICLTLTKEGYEGRNVPYLEIRSRDCLNDEFIARVLCYGVEAKDLIRHQEQLIQNLKLQGFNQKGIVRWKKGKEIFPKQVGYTDKLKAITDENFIKLTAEWGEKYLEAMKDWQ